MSLNCGSITLLNKLDCSNLDISLDNSNSHISVGYNSDASNNSISIGNSSSAAGINSIAIGTSAKTVSQYSISIGSNAYASGTNYDIAIGGLNVPANAAKTDSSWNCVIGNIMTSNVKFKGKKGDPRNYSDIHCNRIICREILIDKGPIERREGRVSDRVIGLDNNNISLTTVSDNGRIICDPNYKNNKDYIAATIAYNQLWKADLEKSVQAEDPKYFNVTCNGNMYLKPGNDVMTSTPTGGNHVYAGGGAANFWEVPTCNPILTAGSFNFTLPCTTPPPCLSPSVDGWWYWPTGTFFQWAAAARKSLSSRAWTLSRQSDHRIKQNIAPIPFADSLNKLSLTNPTSFNFKKDHIYSEDSLQHGFIAQELKEHFPEAVTVSTGYLPIDLSSVKITYSDPSKTILGVANIASYKINENAQLEISNASGTILVKIVDFDNTANSITLDKNIPDNFIRLRFLVDDFHYVQYDKFIPITISAIKKLKSTQRQLYDVMKKLTQKIELLEGNKK